MDKLLDHYRDLVNDRKN